MEVHPAHFVAIIGGAVSGSEAASRLSDRGIYSVVFEQGPRPYGKIEEGLPKWHFKLQAAEEKKIDEKLSKPLVHYVPNTKLGSGIDFQDLVNHWGFSAVLLANGAWKDRPLPIAGVDDYIDKGLIYQNPLVLWFNHYHQSKYAGPHYEVVDEALVVGGGLASLDVVKILMLETVLKALKKIGIETDILTLEHKTISAFLEESKLTLTDLGIKGCNLYYRRRIKDMPLAQIPPGAPPERVEKVYQAREKILHNFQGRYMFRFHERQFPVGTLVEDGRLVGLTFVETEIVDGQPVIKEGTEHEVRAPLIISSIGSIPEPIAGIEREGELYEVRDRETGQFRQFDHVFALGNVVTGKGNIKASHDHGKQVADYVMDNFLAWRAKDYEELIKRGAEKAKSKTEHVANFLSSKKLLSVDQVNFILAKIKSHQQKVNYNGDYQEWIDRHALEKIEDVVGYGK